MSKQQDFTARFKPEHLEMIEKIQKFFKKEKKLVLSKAEVLRLALEKYASLADILN